MTTPSVSNIADINVEELNKKRLFYHQPETIVSGMDEDLPLPYDDLTPTSPEGICLGFMGVPPPPPARRISGYTVTFGMGTPEIAPPNVGDADSYWHRMYTNAPGSGAPEIAPPHDGNSVVYRYGPIGYIPTADREDMLLAYLGNGGQESIADRIQQFRDLRGQEPSELPTAIESLRSLATFLTPKPQLLSPIVRSALEEVMEIEPYLQDHGNPDNFWGRSDDMVSIGFLKGGALSREPLKMGVVVPAESSRHTQELRHIVPFLDLMEAKVPTSEELTLFSRYMLDILDAWPDAPELTQTADSSARTKDRARLLDDLRTAFRQEPFEDGVEHEAEEIIGSALENEYVPPWLHEFITDEENPVFAASVLGCLGRQSSPGSKLWRVRLIGTALAIDNIEVRDAAVVAAHLWGDKELAKVLTSHKELVPWLHEYIQVVVHMLGE